MQNNFIRRRVSNKDRNMWLYYTIKEMFQYRLFVKNWYILFVN